MTAKTRKIAGAFSQQYTSNFRNLVTAGCSFTYNNSERHVCTWPYYLRDLVGFDQVYDCSMPGTGANQMLNSVVYELETNTNINVEKDLIVLMISDAQRTDIITDKKLCVDWMDTLSGGGIDPYEFNQSLATFSIHNFLNTKNKDTAGLCKNYKSTFGFDGQILESSLKIIALYNYLKSKNANFIFLKAWDNLGFENLENTLQNKLADCIVDTKTLGQFSKEENLLEPDKHPNPDAHLKWTKQYLIPLLENQFDVKPL